MSRNIVLVNDAKEFNYTLTTRHYIAPVALLTPLFCFVFLRGNIFPALNRNSTVLGL